MKLKALAFAATILATAVFTPGMTSAAALPAAKAPQSAAADGSLLQEVSRRNRHWRQRCWRWRNICGNRWGWGTRQQRRCMWNHGC